MEETKGEFIANSSLGVPQRILQEVQKASKAFQIISLDKQIEACQELFTESPFIDVAILGQFKAGKSSFINSLIGRPILPVGVIPVTTVITRIRNGLCDSAIVTYFDGKQVGIDLNELEEFISEAKNTANQKNVEVVDIQLPSLEEYAGLRLIDTPGLGSVFKYNTDISEEWLPRVGAAIVAISSDRPLSENDLVLIRQLMEFTPRVVLLLTKVDLLSKEQQDEVVRFFRDALKREFNKNFEILLYSTVKETESYKDLLKGFLISLSENRETEFNSIVQHKVRSLGRQCLSYLDIALTASGKADSDREELRKLILDEKVNYELMQAELALVARDNMQRTRTLIAAYLEDTHRIRLIRKLLADLAGEMPQWKGNLWKLTRRYEKWLEDTMITEMDQISRSDYKHFFGTLKKAHQSISRSIELFRNLLDVNIEKVLGITPRSVDWVVNVSEPSHPDVAFTNVFDFHFDILWCFIPMFLFRRVFENHFLRQVPRVVDIHLSRLAYQWEIRINKSIGEIKEQALEYVRNELSTIAALVSQTGGKTDEIRKMRKQLNDLLDTFGTPKS
jgi:GTP-binding protein EngB required for normal cell division